MDGFLHGRFRPEACALCSLRSLRLLGFNNFQMRILEAVPDTRLNGAIIYARRIVPMLRERGHDVWLAAVPGSWIARELEGVATLVPTDFSRWPLTELKRIAEFCKANKIEVVHSHLTRANNFGAMLRLLHGIPSVGHAHGNHFGLHWWFHTRMIGVSHYTLRRHRMRLAGLRHGDVLHNFVDARQFFPPNPGANDRLRAAFGLPQGCPVVVQAGEISARKGQVYSVRAAALVLREIPSARFVFLGGDSGRGDYREQVNDEVARLGINSAIIWAGLREDVPDLLGWADVAILPSLDESFGLAAVEAMACGVPLVASRVHGIPEIVNSENIGLLVPPADPPALAEAILSLLRDKTRAGELGKAGRQRVLKSFTPEQHIAGLEKILQSAVK